MGVLCVIGFKVDVCNNVDCAYCHCTDCSDAPSIRNVLHRPPIPQVTTQLAIFTTIFLLPVRCFIRRFFAFRQQNNDICVGYVRSWLYECNCRSCCKLFISWLWLWLTIVIVHQVWQCGQWLYGWMNHSRHFIERQVVEIIMK